MTANVSGDVILQMVVCDVEYTENTVITLLFTRNYVCTNLISNASRKRSVKVGVALLFKHLYFVLLILIFI